jgi:hypothetical protein
MVGAIAGALIAVAALLTCVYAAVFVKTTRVYVSEVRESIEVPVNPTFEQVRSAIRALPIDWSKALADGKAVIMTADQIEAIRVRASTWEIESVQGPLLLTVGGAAFAIAWFGFWQLLSWLIRGFLD